ncbi:MAG: hypothetical protein ABEH35_02905 [Haloarculaceae archaeon]
MENRARHRAAKIGALVVIFPLAQAATGEVSSTTAIAAVVGAALAGIAAAIAEHHDPVVDERSDHVGFLSLVGIVAGLGGLGGSILYAVADAGTTAGETVVVAILLTALMGSLVFAAAFVGTVPVVGVSYGIVLWLLGQSS